MGLEMYLGQEFAGRAQFGLGFLLAEWFRLRAGLKMRAECELADSASEAQDKTALFDIFFQKKLLFIKNLTWCKKK